MASPFNIALNKDRSLKSRTDFSGIYGTRPLTDDELRRHGCGAEGIDFIRALERTEGRPASPIVDHTDPFMDLMLGALQSPGPKSQAVFDEFMASSGMGASDSELSEWADKLAEAKAQDLNEKVRKAYEEVGQQAPPDAMWYI